MWVLTGTVSHSIPMPTPHLGNAWGWRWVWGAPVALAALLVLPLASGHFKQSGGRFLPLRGSPSISPPGRGKNPGDAPTETHLPLLLERESGPPKTSKLSLPGEGGGKEGGRAQLRALPTVWGARWIDSSCACPELSSSSIPHPHYPARATATRDCGIAAPIERWVQSPRGDSGCAVQQPPPTGGPLPDLSPRSRGRGRPATSKDLSDFRQEACQDEGVRSENRLQETLRSGPEQPSSSPSSPSSNSGLAVPIKSVPELPGATMLAGGSSQLRPALAL